MVNSWFWIFSNSASSASLKSSFFYRYSLMIFTICPDMIVSLPFVLFVPKYVHLHSLIPNRCNLLFLIFLITWACFHVSYMVRTFQKPILSLVPVFCILFMRLASSWLSLVAFMSAVCCWYSDASRKVKLFLVLVSVMNQFSRKGRMPPCSTSNLVDQRFVIRLPSSRMVACHSWWSHSLHVSIWVFCQGFLRSLWLSQGDKAVELFNP